jgi:peptidyl-tRNA hydrolase, PTH1 family
VADVVVGLGNPGEEYRETRHNIGHRVVDRLAQTLHRRFTRERQAMVARAQWRGEPLHLVKPLAFMNVTGPAVAAALRHAGAGPADLIVVYDDIDLPFGTVRVRMKGSSGGHNGMKSIIAALGTEDIRRVKVGVGRPEHKADVPDHVLAPFEPEELSSVDSVVAEAAARVLTLLHPTSGRSAS